MSMVKSFTVGGITYNAAMASAVDQDKLLSLLTAAIIERAMIAANANLEMSDAVLVPMFMAMPQNMKSQVSDILLGKVVIHGADRVIGVSDFGGNMVNYNMLLAQLLRWNLSDFFGWLPGVLSDDRADQQGSVAR